MNYYLCPRCGSYRAWDAMDGMCTAPHIVCLCGYDSQNCTVTNKTTVPIFMTKKMHCAGEDVAAKGNDDAHADDQSFILRFADRADRDSVTQAFLNNGYTVRIYEEGTRLYADDNVIDEKIDGYFVEVWADGRAK